MKTKKLSLEQGDQSSSHINDQVDIQLDEFSQTKQKVITKLDTNKHFSCLHIHKNTVYLGTRNSKLYIYKISLQQDEDNQFTLSQQKIITPHCQVVSLVKANDKYFITVPESDQDSFISIWDTKSRMFRTALKGHKSQVSQIVFMKDNKFFASASWDCTVRIWSLQDLQKDQPIKTYTGNYPTLELKQFNDQILVFGGDDCYLVFWNWKKQQVIKKEFGHAGSVTFIQTLGTTVLTAGGDNKFKLWQISQDQRQERKKQESTDLKSNYIVKKVQQQKQQYDSIIFGTFYKDDLLMMDRQGEMFLFTKHKSIHRLTNHFQYNQNITGIDEFKDFLLVTTTKGCLKHFNMRIQKETLHQIQISSSESNNAKVNRALNSMKVAPSSQSEQLQDKKSKQ